MNRAERLRFMAECIEPKIIKEQQGRARVGLIDEYKQDISALIWAAELEAKVQELVDQRADNYVTYRHKLDELEAERDQLLDKICADRDFHAKNRAKHTALVDGLRELPDKWRSISYKTTNEYTNLHGCADELEALLGKEPAPSSPTADDGTDAADGVGS